MIYDKGESMQNSAHCFNGYTHHATRNHSKDVTEPLCFTTQYKTQHFNLRKIQSFVCCATGFKCGKQHSGYTN